MSDTPGEVVEVPEVVESEVEVVESTPEVPKTDESAVVATTPPAESVDEKAKPAAPQTKEDWRDRRIAQLTARLREAQQAAPTPAGEAGIPVADFDARVKEEATRLAQVERFNQQCLDVVAVGKTAYPDFDSRVTELKRVADPSDSASALAYSNLIAAAIETGEGAKIIHQLGGNLDEATRLMGLSPVKMGMELAKMAMKEAEVVSGAPKPMRPLGSAAQHSAIDPSDPERAGRLSKAEWFKRREEQVAEKRKRA